MPQTLRQQRVNQNKLAKRLRRAVGQAIADFNMIENGDRVMVCVSGGKDSYALADILWHLKQSAPVQFDILAVNLDQKQPGFPQEVLPQYFTDRGIPFHVIEQDTYTIVKDIIPEGKTMCSLCSRLRRGIIYSFAEKHGYNKIALGHHREDLLETFLMNMFHGGKLKTMPAKLISDDGKNIVIRPLAYCREKDLSRFAEYKQFPIIPCSLCGSQDNLERVKTKQLLREWEKRFPGRIENMFRSLSNVAPSHLLDTDLYDYDVFQLKEASLKADIESNDNDETSKIVSFPKLLSSQQSR